MRAYRVDGGPARIGAGQIVGLTPLQFAARSHRLDVVEKTAKAIHCRPREVIEFKAGEIVLLAEAPSKGMADRLVPVDGEDDGRPRAAVEAAKGGRKPRKPAEAAGAAQA